MYCKTNIVCNNCYLKMRQKVKKNNIHSSLEMFQWEYHTECCHQCHLFKQEELGGRPKPSRKNRGRPKGKQPVNEVLEIAPPSWQSPQPLSPSCFILQFKRAFLIFASCHQVYSRVLLSDEDLKTLGKGWSMIHLLVCIKQCVTIHCRREYYRSTLPGSTITPKLHMLEDHILPFLKKWKVGFGLGSRGRRAYIPPSISLVVCMPASTTGSKGYTSSLWNTIHLFYKDRNDRVSLLHMSVLHEHSSTHPHTIQSLVAHGLQENILSETDYRQRKRAVV